MAAEYRADRKIAMDRYPLKSEVRAAVEADDVAYLSGLVNPYPLRFYFFVAGMSDADFLHRMRAAGAGTPKKAGDERMLVHFLNKRLPEVGNGASEIRNWLAAHGAAGGRGFELIDYSPVPEVCVGRGFAAWDLGAATPRG